MLIVNLLSGGLLWFCGIISMPLAIGAVISIKELTMRKQRKHPSWVLYLNFGFFKLKLVKYFS